MATAAISAATPNDSLDAGESSDNEDDIVVRRKCKNNVLLSDDEDDANITHSEVQVDEKRVSGSEEKITMEGVMADSDKDIDKSLSDRLNTVNPAMNFGSTVTTTILEKTVTRHNVESKSINNNISKSIDGDTAKSKSHSISLYPPSELSQAEEGRNEEKSFRNPKRFTNILDSDSEDERDSAALIDNKMGPSNDASQYSRSTSPQSDCSFKEENHIKAASVRKPRRMVNSESDGEEETTDRRATCVAEEPEDIQSSLKSTGNCNVTLKSSKISALIDSESEEDNPVTHKSGGSSDEREPMAKSGTAKKKGKTEKNKRTGSIRAAKEEAMREIHSESQRMLRESQVRLPYHRPRQRTLQEFLNRRKDLPKLPATLTTAAKVKIAGEIVGKVLEEKEKEAELFYKSSSESDNEEGNRADIATLGVEPKPKLDQNNEDYISAIEETQKITRNDPHNSQNAKEVIQQGEKSLGLPRKLFDCPESEAEARGVPSPMVENDSAETTNENQDCNQKRKEFKQGLKDVSVPRKLFGSECAEPMDIDHREGSGDCQWNSKNAEIPELCETSHSEIGVLKKADKFVGNEVADVPLKISRGRKNESMEEETEDFELKMSEDPCETINAKMASHETALPDSSTTTFEAITETPFINNREVSKLSEKEETDSGTILVNDKLADANLGSLSAENEQSVSINGESFRNSEDSADEKEPFGHVYGLPLPEFDDNKSKKMNTRILPDIMRLTPRLQGSPDTMIELSPPTVGVNQLIKRFLSHSVAKKLPESSPEVTAMRTEQTADGLRVVNQVLPYRIPVSEKNDDPELSKPGAKLVRLKEDLQHQMAMQRTKDREKKELEMKTSEAEGDVYRDERSDCGMEGDDDLEEDEEEEEELSSEGESEPDENDVVIKEAKNKYKSPFVDAEAEVSEEEEQEDGNDGDSEDNSNGDDEDEEDEENELGATRKDKPAKLKRITKAFEDDDSTDSEVEEMVVNASDDGNDRRFGRKRTDVDMFATDNNSDDDWLSGTEGDLPVYQRRLDERSQICATPSVANNSLSIVSPITQLTALNTGSESVNTDLTSSENASQFLAPLSVETTPIEVKCYRDCSSEKRDKLQKKLFDDVRETPNDAELMGLCSGQFSDSPSDVRELDRLMHTTRKSDVSEAELLDLCSGTFATQPADINETEASSQKVQDVAVPLRDFPPPPDKSAKEQIPKAATISSNLKLVFSSDDEDDAHGNSRVENAKGKNWKKKVRRLTLTDDEKESDNESLSDLNEGENDEEEKFVDYDSEENEIMVAKKDIKKVAARFLDEEAELSESEWGSADEDERDLDKLDLEEGDLEDIDQDQVKNQLEKIHMRQVLDEDQREVRLLQEILLEDGELHSDNASRQRKFKWKNIDELEEDGKGLTPSLDEEILSVDPNEAESELEWRKQRLEREKFLQEQRVKDGAAGVEDETEDSQLLQLGLRALKKNKTTKLPNKDVSQAIVVENPQTSIVRHTVADLFASPSSGKKTFALQTAIHRGSFLARGEESLARLSVITKQNSDPAIIRTKKSRNFVFAHLSPAIEGSVGGEESDGQENTQTTDSKVRKRKPTFTMTPTGSKKAKKEYGQSNTTRSKLFN